jgi:hypothetical protein
MEHKLLHPSRVFNAFKYAVYLALTYNIWLFFGEDFSASLFLLDGESGLLRHIEVFAATIDTFAWVILLLLFELETSVLPDSRLRDRRIKWSIHSVRVLCALVIANSLLGYIGKYLGYIHVELLQVDACSLADSGWSLLESFDEFVALSAANCSSVGTEALYRLHGADLLASESVLSYSRQMGLLDVMNASAWIFVVILLEADVRLQMRGALSGLVLRASTIMKFATYAVLLVAALCWGILGSFLDFWDAFLWLVAFVFIELNLFQWQRETEHMRRVPTYKA